MREQCFQQAKKRWLDVAKLANSPLTPPLVITGKTVTSLAIMTCYQAEWPLLILCPASLKYTWPAEIEKFLPSMPASAVYVVAGFQDLGFLIASGMDVKKGIQVVVVSYSLFQRRSAVSHAITADMFHCIIADESHNLKCKDSQRSDILLPLLTRSKRLILLSGTPALSRPAELWTQLHALRPSAFGTWKDFAARYCNPTKKHIGQGRYMMDYTGSSNEGELHAKLKHVMVRRLKSSVLAELPSKQRTVIPVTMSAHELVKCKQAMADLKEKWTASCSLEQLVVTDNSSNFEAKTALVKAFQQTGIGKAASIADYLTTVWLPGCSDSNKILVFAHHSAVLDTIEQALWKGVSSRSPKQHIRIDGSVPAANRTQLVRQFQTCSGIRVALLSMTAAGVGLTLTAASTVLFAELHWTPGVLAQAEDRAHRIGQTADAVQILYMVNRDPSQSVDMTLWKMLGKKIHTLDQIVDGKQVRLINTCYNTIRRWLFMLLFTLFLPIPSVGVALPVFSSRRRKCPSGEERPRGTY